MNWFAWESLSCEPSRSLSFTLFLSYSLLNSLSPSSLSLSLSCPLSKDRYQFGFMPSTIVKFVLFLAQDYQNCTQRPTYLHLSVYIDLAFTVIIHSPLNKRNIRFGLIFLLIVHTKCAKHLNLSSLPHLLNKKKSVFLCMFSVKSAKYARAT